MSDPFEDLMIGNSKRSESLSDSHVGSYLISHLAGGKDNNLMDSFGLNGIMSSHLGFDPFTTSVVSDKNRINNNNNDK